jgi:hypothetical protein
LSLKDILILRLASKEINLIIKWRIAKNAILHYFN